MLQHDPGNYEWVRRVLGHRNIQTTINFYIGLETTQRASAWADRARARPVRERGGGVMRSLSCVLAAHADRDTWQQACRPHVRLRGGAAAGMKPVTQADLVAGTATSSTTSTDAVCSTWLPRGRAGHAGSGRELAEVRSIWRSVTQAQSTYKLRRMAEILAPERDFSWLREIEKDLALVACLGDRFDRIDDRGAGRGRARSDQGG